MKNKGKLHTQSQIDYWAELILEHHIPNAGVSKVLSRIGSHAYNNDRDVRMLHARIVQLEKEIAILKRKK